MSPRKKKLEYCINHADVAATGTCSECAKPICYNCILELFGQTFCSHRCAILFMVANLFKAITILLGSLIKGVGEMIQWLLSGSPRTFVTTALFVGLTVSLWWNYRLEKAMTWQRAHRAAVTAAVDSVQAPVITAPAGGTVRSNVVAVTGEAEDNRIVSLSVNGTLREVKIPEKGLFSFENIRLNRGDNTLEVRAISADGQVSTLETMTLTYARPAPGYLVRDFSRGPRDQARASFTFDGGAEDNAAGEILDKLKESGVRATFFLTGAFIRQYPDLVRRIVDEGHEVGNHTWSHPHLTSFAQDRRHSTLPGITPEKLEEELSQTARLFKEVSGHEMKPLWRAPFGEYNRDILTWAAQAGYRHVGWTGGKGWRNNGDTMDWVADTNSVLYHPADAIVDKVVRFGEKTADGANGAVFLMHLGTNRHSDPLHHHLDVMIAGLEKRGLKLVPITELMD